MNQDLEHLRLLSIFHYVVAGLVALFACIPFLHLFMGFAMIHHWGDWGPSPPPMFVGWMLIAFAAFFISCGWALAICIALSGKFLAERRHHTYCIVIAALSCLFAPFGTVLGVFTLLVLLRDSVKRLFDGTAAAPLPAANPPS
jgi:hypothetical protein